MFQYALGRAVAIRSGSPLALDTRALETDRLRSYALGGFRVTASPADPATLPRAPGRLARRLTWLPAQFQWKHRVLERSFTFDPAIAKLRPPVHLSGNWQSERYFLDVANAIREDFQLAAPFTDERAALAARISTENSVSVHVRRGDYVTNPTAAAFHGTCSPEWYAAGRKRMDELVPNANYVVFSDDPQWSKDNLPSLSDAHFVEAASDGRDEQDMHLMASCSHHIIANSSFSWWGAWLNSKPNKIVIAPTQWFKGARHDTSDLIPPSWIRL